MSNAIDKNPKIIESIPKRFTKNVLVSGIISYKKKEITKRTKKIAKFFHETAIFPFSKEEFVFTLLFLLFFLGIFKYGYFGL